MKKIAVILALLLPALTWGYDFALTVPSGQTLYFSYSGNGVAVVKPSTSPNYTNAWEGFDMPVGAVTIPASVTLDGVAYPVLSVEAFAFYNCSTITSVVIGEGIDWIGNSAFSHCTGMTSAVLPSTVTTIGSQAFGDCNALTDMTVNRATPPPATHSGAFFNTAVASCSLHVPCGGEEAYAAATPWSGFGTIETSGCTVTILTAVNNPLGGTVTGGGSYTTGTNVVLTAVPATGFFFVCWNDGDTLNPRIFTATADCMLKAFFFAQQSDSVTVYDTAYVYDTVTLHDTMVVTVTVTEVDTVTLHDTMVVTVTEVDTVTLHDTMVVTVTEVDTVTIYPTFYRLQVLSDNEGLGLGVGSGLLPAGTEAEVCALPLEGGRFLSWSDGVTDNPRKVTLMANLTLTAQFQSLGIEDFTKSSWTLTATGREVTVTGVEGQQVRLYDVAGRQLASVQPMGGTARLALPSAGVYVVRVGDWSAKKIVIEQ
ncbi:MAG: leucine-rich repeat domain-containing protein [bacterium]